MVWPLRLLIIAAVVTAAVVGVGTFLRTPHPDVTSSTPVTPPPSKPLSEPLSAVDTTTLTVRRAPFCHAIATADLRAALGGPVQRTSSYGAGQSVTVGDGLTDMVDEYGCRWSAADSQAAAWVFAAPVTAQWAGQLAADVPHGCESLHGIEYGAPSAPLRCGHLIQLRGLFGDAWLTCQLQTRDLDLAGRFCLAVARAAG